jgi:transketolase
MDAVAPYLPTMVGGSADLAGSTLAILPGEDEFGPGTTGRTVHWGIREHAMGSAVNGLALHGGIVRRTAGPSSSSPITCAPRSACRR